MLECMIETFVIERSILVVIRRVEEDKYCVT